jgi:hypothetical protein
MRRIACVVRSIGYGYAASNPADTSSRAIMRTQARMSPREGTGRASRIRGVILAVSLAAGCAIG